MRTKQSILEEYDGIPDISVKDIMQPAQKFIHFWDFINLDDRVFELSAQMACAIEDLKKDLGKRYRDYYTHVMLQTPERFTRHNRELLEIEFMLENPLFLAILHFALTKDNKEQLRHLAVLHKKRLMEKRMDIKNALQRELAANLDSVTR